MKFILKFDWLCEMTHVMPAELFFLKPEGNWSICCLTRINVQVSVFPDWHTCINAGIWSASVEESLWMLDSESNGMQPCCSILPSPIWNNLQKQTKKPLS